MARRSMFAVDRGRRRGQRLRIAVRAIAGVLVVVMITALFLWRYTESRLTRVQLQAISERSAPAEAAVTNTLVVVTDRSDPEGPSHVDQILLFQVGPQREQPVAVVLPNLLKVSVPGAGDQHLEELLLARGRDETVHVVEQYAGLEVDHYVEVALDRLDRVADSVGGVRDCPTLAAPSSTDPAAAEESEAAELQACDAVLDGAGLVAAARSSSGDGFELTQRRAGLAIALLDTINSLATQLNPLRMRAVADTLGHALVVDDAFSSRSLWDIAGRLAELGSGVELRAVPGYLSAQTGFVHARPEEAARLFQALRLGEALPDVGRELPDDLTNEDVRVVVLNGQGTEGLAGLVADELTAAGFRVVNTDNHTDFDVATSFIEATAASEPHARLLAEQFGGIDVRIVERLSLGGDAVLVIGADLAGDYVDLPDDEAEAEAT